MIKKEGKYSLNLSCSIINEIRKCLHWTEGTCKTDTVNHTNPIFTVILTINNGLQEITYTYEGKNQKEKNTAFHWPIDKKREEK